MYPCLRVYVTYDVTHGMFTTADNEDLEDNTLTTAAVPAEDILAADPPLKRKHKKDLHPGRSRNRNHNHRHVLRRSPSKGASTPRPTAASRKGLELGTALAYRSWSDAFYKTVRI